MSVESVGRHVLEVAARMRQTAPGQVRDITPTITPEGLIHGSGEQRPL
jgi:hypothetical protein